MDSVPQIQSHVAPAARARWQTQTWARTLLEGGALLAVCLLLFGVVQYGTPGLVDNDAYYHTRMARLIREQGLTPAFVWLPYSILRPETFYDHHMLYHVYLALFVGDGRPEAMVAGAKLASVLMPSLAALASWWLLRCQGVPWAGVWALGFFALSEAFLFRMSMTRAQAASLLALVLALHWLLRRRYRLLLPLGFLYVWLYNAFPLLLLVAGTYVAAALLAERRLAWQAIAYPALGVALGVVVNPYFPDNVVFTLNHLAPKIGGSEVGVGNEWYPYDTWALVQNSGLGLAAWLAAALGMGWRERRVGRATLTAFALSVVFGLMLFKSRRFIEYFPPFALIFCALSLGPQLAAWGASRPRLRRLAPVIMAVALAVPAGVTVLRARDTMSRTGVYQTFAGASAWLGARAQPGEIVFQTDWDDFPMLFFFNPSNRYTIGLDPTYMERYDAAMFDEWVRITRGQVERPGALIRSRYGAAYVVSDLRHEAFMRQAAGDPLLREVYRDQYAIIYAVGS